MESGLKILNSGIILNTSPMNKWKKVLFYTYHTWENSFEGLCSCFGFWFPSRRVPTIIEYKQRLSDGIAVRYSTIVNQCYISNSPTLEI